MNINGFIKYHKDESFNELPFSYVDGLILSELSYVNLDLLFKKKQKELRLGDISSDELTKKIFEGSVDASRNKIMLHNMITSKRYQDIIIKNVKRYFSKENYNQFLAFTAVLPNKRLFISYRGTDTTLIGWREDFLLLYKKGILSQEQALKYARYVLRDNKMKFYLGGHSKGGNLAFYTALNLSKEYTSRLIEAYSYDGPGFREGIKDFPSYKLVIKKMIKFRTYNNVIGSIFNNMDKYKVVYSPGLLLGGHDPFYWQINKEHNDFKYAKDTSKLSKKYSARCMNWLESLTLEDRELAADALFTVFDKNDTIYDLLRNFIKNLSKLNKSLEKFSEEQRDKLRVILRRFFRFLVDSNKIKGMKKEQKILDKEIKENKHKKKKANKDE